MPALSRYTSMSVTVCPAAGVLDGVVVVVGRPVPREVVVGLFDGLAEVVVFEVGLDVGFVGVSTWITGSNGFLVL